MSLFDTFGTSTTKEQQGVRVEYPANKDGTTPTFYIARASKGNKEWAKAFERATRPYKQAIRLKTITPEQWEKVGRQVFFDAILKGWENVQDRKGANIEYTRQNAEQLMQELPDLYYDLDERSTDMDLFKAEELEADSGN